MTARDVLDRVIAAGALILSDDAGPYLDNVPAELVPLVAAHRFELRRLILPGAPTVEKPAMPSLTAERLAVFAREGDAVGFRVPWCERLLWWAPTATEAAKLVAWGIAARGAVWTASELEALIGLAGPDARAVVAAKLALGGDVVEARPR